MNPTSELSSRNSEFRGRPIPRFDLSVKHMEWFDRPEEVISVSYCPSPLGPTSELAAGAEEGALECRFQHEKH
jgi:hypothetical protein